MGEGSNKLRKKELQENPSEGLDSTHKNPFSQAYRQPSRTKTREKPHPSLLYWPRSDKNPNEKEIELPVQTKKLKTTISLREDKWKR